MRSLISILTLALLSMAIASFVDPISAQAKAKEADSASKSEKKTKESEVKKHSDGKIGVGDQAPELALPDQNGKTISLRDFLGKKVVVFYFYPKDNTSVCTTEACSFRDSYQQFSELGAEVIGVSSDSAESHKKFAEKNHLQFPLLADTSSMARKAFGVPSTAGIIPGRVTYVIDKNGVVRYVFNSMMDGPKHVTEAMKIVKELCAAKPAN